jgi:hypothetical protein
VPWPVAHGGFTDLYYKLVYLHKAGVNIHLHCFKKDNRQEESQLQKYCSEVNYYKRETGAKGFSFPLPYIVGSRLSKELISNLSKDTYPILIEGIHCSYILYKDIFPGRKILVRLHNIEYKYYRQLAKHESNLTKKLYFLSESFLLKRYEKVIAKKALFLTVSESDAAAYRKNFKADAVFLPVFISYTSLAAEAGKGTYCLYHGNLAISENETAAIWLLEKVFHSLDVPLVIAGKDPSQRLTAAVSRNPGTVLVISPSEEKMQELIRNAQVNVLPSFNNTGVKLKLLNALYNGRHCIVNPAAIKGSGTEQLCITAKTANDFRKEIQSLYQLPFTESMLQERNKVLNSIYNNEKKAAQLMTLIW